MQFEVGVLGINHNRFVPHGYLDTVIIVKVGLEFINVVSRVFKLLSMFQG